MVKIKQEKARQQEEDSETEKMFQSLFLTFRKYCLKILRNRTIKGEKNMQTGKMINRISNRLRRRSRAIQESLGITGAQGNILDYIIVESGSHSVYQKEIEEEFGLRPSTATEALKTLEKKGLIRREAEKQDARYKKIVFTEKAETIREALRTEIEESEQLLLKGISAPEQKEFLRITEQMLKNLDAAGKEG